MGRGDSTEAASATPARRRKLPGGTDLTLVEQPADGLPSRSSFSDDFFLRFLVPVTERPGPLPGVRGFKLPSGPGGRFRLPLEIRNMLTDPVTLWAEAAQIAREHHEGGDIRDTAFESLVARGLNELPGVRAKAVGGDQERHDVVVAVDEAVDFIQIKSHGSSASMQRDSIDLYLQNMKGISVETFATRRYREQFVEAVSEYCRASTYFIAWRRVTSLKKPPETIKHPQTGRQAVRYEKYAIHPSVIEDEIRFWLLDSYSKDRLGGHASRLTYRVGSPNAYLLALPSLGGREKLKLERFPLAKMDRLAYIHQELETPDDSEAKIWSLPRRSLR